MTDSTMPQPSVTLSGGGRDLAMPQFGVGFWEVPDDVTARIAHQALDLGYRSIDTAMLYHNEEGVGRAIADSDVPREEIFLTTKVWNSDQGYEETLAAFEDSLARLATDYVDLYLIHWPTPARGLYLDTWRAMRDLREQGRARAIGVCNFTIEHLQAVHEEFGEYPSLNQVERHPYLVQPELKAFHDDHGIITEDWSPLAARLDLIADPVVVAVAEQVGCTPAQAVYRWHLQDGCVVIPRTTKPERLVENLGVLEIELNPEQMRALSGLDRGTRTGPDPVSFNRA